MDLATKAAIDRLRKIAVHGPALMSVSREDAQRIVAELDSREPLPMPTTEEIERRFSQLHVVELDGRDVVGGGGYASTRLALGDELSL